MAQTSRLILIAITITVACSKKAAPPAQHAEGSQAPTHDDKPAETKAPSSVTPIALAPELLPGWTFRSADDGWWSAAGDEQLFVSHVDLGNLAAGKPAAERAELMANVYREANRRQGGAPLVVDTGPLATQVGRPVACVTAVSAKDHAHAFSCGVARDTGPVVGIEYTSYRNETPEVFDERARKLVGSVAAVAN